MARNVADLVSVKIGLCRDQMNPAQLRETTMNPATRSLIRITLPPEFEDRAKVKELVDQLMGRNPEHRFNFIQNNAGDMDREMIDA